MKRIEIQRALVTDAHILAQIHVISWQETYRGILPDDFMKGFTYQKRENAFREALANKLEETYIAIDGDNAIGILTVGSSRDDDLDNIVTGEIWGIYLLPGYWRRGIGTTLVKEGEKHSTESRV